MARVLFRKRGSCSTHSFLNLRRLNTLSKTEVFYKIILLFLVIAEKLSED